MPPLLGAARAVPRPVAAGRSPSDAADDDARLVRAVRAGDVGAFEVLFRRYHAGLAAFAERYVRDAAHAEDLVQDVFMYVWAHRSTWAAADSAGGYLFAAVRNAAMSSKRHAGVVARSEPALALLSGEARPTPDADAIAAERQAAVRDAVLRLPERCRLVFTLHREQGLTYREIAQALGISAKTVDAQMGRAAKALRQRLGPHWP